MSSNITKLKLLSQQSKKRKRSQIIALTQQSTNVEKQLKRNTAVATRLKSQFLNAAFHKMTDINVQTALTQKFVIEDIVKYSLTIRSELANVSKDNPDMWFNKLMCVFPDLFHEVIKIEQTKRDRAAKQRIEVCQALCVLRDCDIILPIASAKHKHSFRVVGITRQKANLEILKDGITTPISVSIQTPKYGRCRFEFPHNLLYDIKDDFKSFNLVHKSLNNTLCDSLIGIVIMYTLKFAGRLLPIGHKYTLSFF